MAKLLSLLIMFILFIFFFFFFFTPTLSCPPECQKQALLQFTASLANLTDDQLKLYNSSSDGCSFPFVKCSSSNVIEIFLGDLNPLRTPWRVWTSTILTPLFHIRTLTVLDLSFNGIQGELPRDGFANLSKLVHLDLSGNNFTGSLPSQLFQLRSLQFLDMAHNSFHGNIPPEIGNMTKLSSLNFSDNNFFGAIPTSIVSLKELRALDLGSNSLSFEIPIDFGNLSNIDYLVLSCNSLTGTIPSSIQNLKKLDTLKFIDNSLSGEFPSWLFDMKNLTRLLIGGNNFIWNNSAKTVPKFTLSELSLKSCGLAGKIPDCFLGKDLNMHNLAYACKLDYVHVGLF
nr:probable LRR receptor-like serine/threonine-protein kinase At1g34110 [Quercus suber]